MATWQIVFVCTLLVLSANGKDTAKEKKKAAAPATGGTQTRGHFGFSGRPNRPGYGQQGFNQQGFGHQGPHNQGFPQQGFQQGFPQQGFQQQQFPQQGFNQQGFHQQGFHQQQPGVVPGGFVQPTGFPGGIVGGGVQASGSAGCRYWCKTPEGQAYCCESSNQPANHPIAAVIDKGGRCPPVRGVCPLRIHNINAPNPCSKHGDCFNADRCCFDRCLGEHVCKAPLYG